jgi:hypothetical protein
MACYTTGFQPCAKNSTRQRFDDGKRGKTQTFIERKLSKLTDPRDGERKLSGIRTTERTEDMEEDTEKKWIDGANHHRIEHGPQFEYWVSRSNSFRSALLSVHRRRRLAAV